MPGGDKINKTTQTRARILIAALDWGLGHTTRCLPIIKAFQELGCEILIAGNSNQAQLLRAEFPRLKLIPLKGYGLRYAKYGWLTRWKILWQIPKILTSIKAENTWLNNLLGQEKIDVVISDSRFGLHHPSVFSIFITHQLRIKIPFSKWLEIRLQKWNYRLIEKFDECWIPDYKENTNLAGTLSHPGILPGISTKYIGPLSRFVTPLKQSSPITDLVFILSGPEPQRTIFEKLITNQLKNFDGTAIVLRGLPKETNEVAGFQNISFINHLPAEELSRVLINAKMVISRAGYSTIMDLIALRKKSIYIPTPGQTEQEYLAQYLMEKKFSLCFQQEKFSLQNALEAAARFNYSDMSHFEMNGFRSTLEALVERFTNASLSIEHCPDPNPDRDRDRDRDDH